MTNYLPGTISTREDMELPWPDETTARDRDGDLLVFRHGRWRAALYGSPMRGDLLPYTDVHLPESAADVTVGGVRMTQEQYNAVRESLEASLAVEPASYPLPVFGPDAKAEDIANSIPGGLQTDVARIVMGWLDAAQLADRIPDAQAVMVANWLMADFEEASDVIGCIPRPLYLGVLTGLLERVNPEAIADHMPAEHVQDVATLLNARAREQEAVVKARAQSDFATTYLLNEIGSLVSLTTADKQRLRDAIDAHETENRA